VLSAAETLKMVRFVAFGADEPRRRPSVGRGERLFAATTAALVIAASAYWVGTRSAREQGVASGPPAAADQPPSMPLPRVAVEQPLPVAPTTKPSTPLPVHPATADAERSPPATRNAKNPPVMAHRKSPDVAEGLKRPAAPHTTASQKEIVRIGRFVTDKDAEKGWADVLQRWPDMWRLSAVPVQIESLRNGKTYYRLQVTTPSRAYSEVVCKRAHDLDQSCTVMGAAQVGSEGPF